MNAMKLKRGNTKWVRNCAIFAVAVVVLVVATLEITQRFSDGPLGPLPGGRLRAGPLVSEPDVDWSIGEGELVELQLVEPLGSRTTAAFLYEDQLYVGCDLGFVSDRAPAPARWLSSLISGFKRWHEDALLDGRVVLRIAGTRYERQAVRVTDPQLLTRLRLHVEEGAEKTFGAPLDQAPATGAGDIWFFRMDPRPVAIDTGAS